LALRKNLWASRYLNGRCFRSGSSRFTISTGTRLVQAPATDTPRITGVIAHYPPSGALGLDSTDTIYLVGHADGLEINNPYQVSDIRALVNLKAFFDVYNEGARDVWLVASAPMSEYIRDIDDRNVVYESLGDKTFYEKYHERLDTTYEILEEFGIVEIVVPVEASFYGTGGVDFLIQLADHCSNAFDKTDNYRLGILGTRIDTIDDNTVSNMVNDSRLSTLESNGKGKFVCIMGGEVSVKHPQIELGYSTQVATLGAGKLSTARANQGLSNALFKSAITPSFADWGDEQLSSLAQAKINWVKRSIVGRRGVPYQVSLATDNLLTPDGSTLWSIPQVRTMWKVLYYVKSMGNRYIGTISYPKFKQDVFEYMNFLVDQLLIKDYNVDIYRDDNDPNLVRVDMGLILFGNIRELFVSVGVGNKNMVG
jgi:hypothetical protein